MRLTTTALLLCLFCYPCVAQEIIWENEEWATDLKRNLQEFLSCGEPTPQNSACNIFLAKSLSRVYHIDDFIRTGTPSYLTANEIASYTENDDKWTLLGMATEQNVLNQAQGYANLGKAVVAVLYEHGTHGHVCLIIPGNLAYSSTWNLNCPNSASFFLNKSSKSYVGQKLSFAFSDKSRVKIYGRNYQ